MLKTRALQTLPREVLNIVIPTVAFDTAVKLPGMDEIQELREDIVAGEHGQDSGQSQKPEQTRFKSLTPSN